MVNIRTLIRIVFVIFIANGIDCLGSDTCCIPPKYENNIKYENITAKSLVNENWFKAKKDNLVLEIFEKKDNGIFTYRYNEDYKFSLNFDGNNNPKITYQDENEDVFKLKKKKYALFEIITKGKNTVYLYCSNVESSKNKDGVSGIFQDMDHKSISVIACDTEKVKNMRYMFCFCTKLINLNVNNFSTTNVTDMKYMFYECSSLEELNLENFNTKNVKNMNSMFSDCSSLKELDLKNFNTTNVKDMESMFYKCSSLTKLDLNNFDTTNVTDMNHMFFECSNLTELDISNFNTTNVANMAFMFYNCSKLTKLEIGADFNIKNVENKKKILFKCKILPDETKNKILGKNKKSPDETKNKILGKNKKSKKKLLKKILLP